MKQLPRLKAVHLFFLMLLSVALAGISSALFRWELFASGSFIDFIQFLAFGIGVQMGFIIPFVIYYATQHKLNKLIA